MSERVGFAHFFENVVVFCPTQDLFTFLMAPRRRRRAGSYLGSVKGLVPYDPYHILIEDLKERPAIEARRKQRAWLRRHHIKRREMRKIRPLKEFLK